MLISIIVPVYNTEKYLEKCIDSLVNQSYKELEIILVDDGSTDTSGGICDNYSQKYENIKVFHQSNAGSSAARNKGIMEAKGEFLGFVDSDDYVSGDFVKIMVDNLGNDDMIQISRDEKNPDGTGRQDVCIPPKEIITISNHEQMRQLLLHTGDCSFCTRLTNRNLFDLNSFEPMLFPEGKLNEDFYLLVKMLSSGKLNRYKILPQQYYHVVYREGSNSRKEPTEFSRVYMDIVENADMVEGIVRTDFPDLLREAKRFALIQRLDYMLHIPVKDMNEENVFYKKVCKYLKKNFSEIMNNVLLTGKNRRYLILMAMCPAFTRKVHRKIRNK